MAARLTFRVVELLAHRGPPDGPVLAVSNNLGGAADPVLLIYLSERMPRIVPRDVIWRVPVARSVMRSIQAIPVHKAGRGDPTALTCTGGIRLRPGWGGASGVLPLDVEPGDFSVWGCRQPR